MAGDESSKVSIPELPPEDTPAWIGGVDWGFVTVSGSASRVKPGLPLNHGGTNGMRARSPARAQRGGGPLQIGSGRQSWSDDEMVPLCCPTQGGTCAWRRWLEVEMLPLAGELGHY